MAEFLQEVKSISDSLAVINYKIPDPDIVMYVLNGLGRDYDNFVIFIQNRENPLSFGDLKEKILTHEQWLKTQHLETSVALSLLPILLSLPKSSLLLHLDLQNQLLHLNQLRLMMHLLDLINLLINGLIFQPLSVKSVRKKVNMASRCPYRYYPSKNNPQSRRNPQANSSLQVHTSNLSEHSVFPAAGSWLPDSAATSYMTPDVSLLINPTTYTESEKVMVGNNFHIPISLVGSAILHTPTKSFTLSNVLFVPNLTQNLISVGVFTAEHNCKIGFTPWGYEITDLDSQLVLAEGVMHQNLYHIASKPSVKALTSIVASPSV